MSSLEFVCDVYVIILNLPRTLLSGMADITPLFKATVKAVKARLKAQGEISHPDKSILGSAKQKSEFSIKAKNVVCGSKCSTLYYSKCYQTFNRRWIIFLKNDTLMLVADVQCTERNTNVNIGSGTS